MGNIEGANFVKTGKLVSLSEQELVDCDNKTGDSGCNGGLPKFAYEDMIQNKFGLETERDYPYVGAGSGWLPDSGPKCQLSQEKEKVFISNWTQISKDEDQIAAALVKHGPLSIGLNAGPMQFYWGGISDPWLLFCNPQRIDHGVTLVGFGHDNSTNKSYWIIRNSWGPSWGEKGYYRLIRGHGACGVNKLQAVQGSGLEGGVPYSLSSTPIAVLVPGSAGEGKVSGSLHSLFFRTLLRRSLLRIQR